MPEPEEQPVNDSCRPIPPSWPALVVAIAMLVPGSTAATPVETGRFVLEVIRQEGESRAYAVWLPPGFESRSEWPAIVFLHGSGECGTDATSPTRVGIGPALQAHPERWPFVVVFPQKPSPDEEWEERESLVLAILERARRQFRVDPRRTSLVGISQGGHGTWVIGARRPDLWASLVPVCGYGNSRRIATRVARVPLWAFHGLRDGTVNPADTRAIVAGVRDARSRLGIAPEGARLTLYPQADHNSWDSAFAEPELPRWILRQSKRGTPNAPR